MSWGFAARRVFSLALCGFVSVQARAQEAESDFLVTASEQYARHEYDQALASLAKAKSLARSQAEMALALGYEGIILAIDPATRSGSIAAFRSALELWPDSRLPVDLPDIEVVYEHQRSLIKAKVLESDRPQKLNPHLVAASAAYGMHELEDARMHLVRARTTTRNRAELALVLMYEGMIEAETPGQSEVADVSFRTALELWPEARLPVPSFRFESRLESIRSELKNERALAMLDDDRPVQSWDPTAVGNPPPPQSQIASAPQIKKAELPWYGPWYLAGCAAIAAVALVGIAVTH